jgi:hypothetical protein
MRFTGISSAAGAGRPTGHALPRGFDANMQAIASAAHKRGVVLMRGSEVTGSLEASDLCTTLRAAHERVRGNDGAFQHVERMANGIASGLGVRGTIAMSQLAWDLISAYAKWKGGKPQ